MKALFEWITGEKLITTLVIYLLLFVLAYLAWLSIPSQGNDGPFEQLVESLIEKETGFQIDISPQGKP